MQLSGGGPDMLIVVNYHYVRPHFQTPHPGIFGMTVDAFREQLSALGEAGEFVTAEEVVLASRRQRPLPERAILITFDDGLREQYEHAWQAMRAMHVPGIIFANTHPIEAGAVSAVHKIHLLRSTVAPDQLWGLVEETAALPGIALPQQWNRESMRLQYPFDSEAGARLKYLLNFALPPAERDWIVDHCFASVFPGEEAAISRELYVTREQMRELADRGALGSHGHEHLPLASMDAAGAEFSLRRSAELLEDWTGIRPTSLAYPYGSLDAVTPAVAETAARCGYDCGFTVEIGANTEGRLHGFPLLLARFDCNYMPGGKLARWNAAELFDHAPVSRWYDPGATGLADEGAVSSGDPGLRRSS